MQYTNGRSRSRQIILLSVSCLELFCSFNATARALATFIMTSLFGFNTCPVAVAFPLTSGDFEAVALQHSKYGSQRVPALLARLFVESVPRLSVAKNNLAFFSLPEF